MTHPKMSAGLASRLIASETAAFITVIVELVDDADVSTPATEDFDQRVAIIRGAVNTVGGSVEGIARVNRTLKCLIPAGRIWEVADLTAVKKVDLPRRIYRED
jgi:hypothetical protein